LVVNLSTNGQSAGECIHKGGLRHFMPISESGGGSQLLNIKSRTFCASRRIHAPCAKLARTSSGWSPIRFLLQRSNTISFAGRTGGQEQALPGIFRHSWNSLSACVGLKHQRRLPARCLLATLLNQTPRRFVTIRLWRHKFPKLAVFV